MSDRSGRPETNARDFLGNQKKALAINDRRWQPRKASDLVGPGIGPNAVRITNLNDLLATFNGFFSADIGAANAPNGTDQFAGMTVSDSALGGTQTFISLSTGLSYTRQFVRSSLDPSALFWSDWVSTGFDLDARLDVLEGLNLGSRMTAAETDINALQAAAQPLYSDTLDFFGTNLTEGFQITGTVTFPSGVFSAAPAAWAVVASTAATGSAPGMVVGKVDNVTAVDCRVVLVNTIAALQTFTGLTVRWFAQKHL